MPERLSNPLSRMRWRDSDDAPTLPLIPVVTTPGGEGASLQVPLLLARAATQLGYQPAILDATLTENDAVGGLIDILEHRQAAQPHLDGDATRVYPAALGVQALLSAGHRPSHRSIAATLTERFSAYSALILRADAPTLAQLVNTAQHIPVLPMTADADALLMAYDNLKLLAGHQAVARALVVTERDASVPVQLAGNIFNSFARCAGKYLGCRLHHCDMGGASDDAALAASLRRWVIPLLRHGAQPERAVAAAAAARTRPVVPSPVAWSH